MTTKHALYPQNSEKRAKIDGERRRRRWSELPNGEAVEAVRGLQRAARSGAGVRDALRRSGGACGGPPDRRQERPRRSPNGLPIQPRRRRHQDPPPHHSPHEVRP
uniref:Uncharacterized protein n=1 Tax=Vitis vinifera TaxID=29760 RepID=A5AWX1_VITVI|nr:hypothetical protein VITISV_033424 [Vitis vinifera]